MSSPDFAIPPQSSSAALGYQGRSTSLVQPRSLPFHRIPSSSGMSQHHPLESPGNNSRPPWHIGMSPSVVDLLTPSNSQGFFQNNLLAMGRSGRSAGSNSAEEPPDSRNAAGTLETAGDEFSLDEATTDGHANDGEASTKPSNIREENTKATTAEDTGDTGDTENTKDTREKRPLPDILPPEDSSQTKSDRAYTVGENLYNAGEDLMQGVTEYDSKGVQTSFEDDRNHIIGKANVIIRELQVGISNKDEEFVRLHKEYTNEITKIKQEQAAELHKVSLKHRKDVSQIELLTSELARKKADLELVLGERLDNVDEYQPLIDADLRDPFLKLRTKVKLFANKHCRAGDKLSLEDFICKMKKYTFTSDISDGAWKTERYAIIQSAIWRRLLDEIFTDPIKVFSTEFSELTKLREELFPSDGAGQHLVNNKKYQTWQSVTTSLFLDRPSHDKKAKAVREAKIDKLTESYRTLMVTALKEDIDPVAISNDALNRGLEDLVKQACYVAAAFVIQRCGLETFDPFPRDDTEMPSDRPFDNVFHEASRDMGEYVEFVVSPGLIKHGNGMGQHMDSSEVLVKAEVMLGSRRDEKR